MDQSLDQFIPVYPDLSKNDSQLVAFALAEIQELKYTKEREDRLKKGEYFKHQIAASRIAKTQNRLFIIDSPGTGKSCKLTLINEVLKSDTNLYRKFIFVTISGLIESLKSQVICKCTNDIYINDTGTYSATAAEIATSNKIKFSTSYTINSYDDFFKQIKNKTVDELNEEFAYSVISFDEVTELILTGFSERIYNKNSETISWTEKISDRITELYNINDMNDITIKNSELKYVQVWRFCHAVPTAKIIFASGIPYSNRPSEQFMLVNCLNDLDKQIDVPEYANNIFRFNLKMYEKYFNGIFLFVESSNIVAKPLYKGQKLPIKYKVEYPANDTDENPPIIIREYGSQMYLYKIELFGYQNEVLFENKKKIISGSVDISNDQMLCYVDINKNFNSSATNDQAVLSNLSDRTINGLYYKMLTCGMYTEIIRIEEERFKKSRLEGKPGPGLYFNYMYLVETLKSFAELFKAEGYEVLYKKDDFKFLSQTKKQYCGLGITTVSGLTKRKRVVFLSDQIPSEVREKILQIAGCADNIHGEYIQFLGGSKVMGIGVNIKNAVGMHRVFSEWNEANDKQSRDRVFREDGHDEIRLYLASQMPGENIDPYSFDIYIDLYNFCCYTRHFYVKSKYLEDLKLNDKYGVTMASENSPLIEMRDNEKYVIINPHNIIHIVGFCDSNILENVTGYELLINSYVKNGEIPYQKLSEKFNIPISSDIGNITNKSKYIILSLCGILYCVKQDSQIFHSFFQNYILLYHINCEFMKDYICDFYTNQCYFISKLNSSKLINVSMLYLSSTEIRSKQLEQKSFGTRRSFRHAKRFAIDCISDHERAFKTDGVNGTLECDYDVCNFTCASDVLSFQKKSDTSFLYEENTEFWNNHEVLYSKEIIKMCKEDIVKMFDLETSVEIKEIFNTLLTKYKREYFVNMAIYELVSEKYPIRDRFGFTNYISSSNDMLYIRRDFPNLLINNVNYSNYSKRLIVVDSNPDYRNQNQKDIKIIENIESIEIRNDIIKYVIENPSLNEYNEFKQYYNGIITLIASQIKNMNYSSIKILIERCFGRIAYSKYSELNPLIYNNPKYKLKDCDRIICNILYSIRCHQITGNYNFVHNQPESKQEAGYGKIKNVKTVVNKENVYIFNIIKDEVVWIQCNDQFFKDIAEQITNTINDSIESTITKVYTDQNGNQNSYKFKYYISYYDEKYRLTTFAEGNNRDGQDIGTIKESEIRTLIHEIINSPYLMMSEINRKIISEIPPRISLTDLRLKIITFFKDNGLVFWYNIPEIDGII